MAARDQAVQFFLKPCCPRQRYYEMVRMHVVDNVPVKDVARRFDARSSTVQTYVRDLYRALDRGQRPEFFMQPKPGPKHDRKKSAVREHVLRLRALQYASTDIHTALKNAGWPVSLSLVDQILREQGLSGMLRRTNDVRLAIAEQVRSNNVPGLTAPLPAAPEQPAVADVHALDLANVREVKSPQAGIFLFAPLLAQANLPAIVQQANLPGSQMIPPISYLLSLLALKLLDKERRSHIDDFSFDEGLGLFAGLNVLPKTTAATNYSYRMAPQHHAALLEGWVRAVYPLICPQAASEFALDFHAIEHRGEDTGLERHFIAARGVARPSVLVCYARTVKPPMLCFSEADILHADKPGMPLRFIDFWYQITGQRPEWLYLDSRMTNYGTLARLNQGGTNFITIRRRGEQMVKDMLTSGRAWRTCTIDTPQRRHQKLQYLDEEVRLRQYDGTCRQIAVTGFGREQPTVYLTNNRQASARQIITRYINRNGIENDIGVNVNFFHLDCLASEVRLNVNLDVTLTVIANGCYRWLAQQLKGCQSMQPKQLYRKFVDTSGTVRTGGDEIVVSLDRRAHNPIIRQAVLHAQPAVVPWLGNRRLRFLFA